MLVPTKRSRRTGQSSPVTLQDVATAAGVSLATASRALHGGTRVVTAQLSERVRLAATRLGYTSNGPARALATASTPVIGLIVHDIADPYFSAMAIGAMRAAHDAGLLVLVCNTFRDTRLELDYLSRLSAQRARGVLLLGSGFTDRGYRSALRREVDTFASLGGRIACVSRHGVGTDVVLPDHRAGGRLAGERLLALGHRRIGVVCGPANLTVTGERLRGLTDVLASGGLTLPDDQVVVSDFSRDGGRDAALTLLRAHPDLTAIFALNDVMALGALGALRDDLGRRIPEEVSLVGYDDIPAATDVTPTLTTVHLPLSEIGAHGMALLLDEDRAGIRTVRIPARLVERDSTGPAPATAGPAARPAAVTPRRCDAGLATAPRQP